MMTEDQNVNNSSNYSMEEFVDTRWENVQYEEEEADLDNSSARLFERSRIKALAGKVYDVLNLRARMSM